MPVVFFDSQFDDAHGVLRNAFGLRDAHELERRIATFSASRVLELSQTPLIGKFDIPHFRRMHQYIFKDVFPWAGDFREVMTSRTGSFGFPPPVYILPSLETLFTQLTNEQHLKGLDADTFADRAGHYLGELNAIHAFREGNGRAQREFIRTLSLTAGRRLTWAGLTPDENNTASRISFATRDHSGLAALIRKRLS